MSTRSLYALTYTCTRINSPCTEIHLHLYTQTVTYTYTYTHILSHLTIYACLKLLTDIKQGRRNRGPPPQSVLQVSAYDIKVIQRRGWVANKIFVAAPY